MSARAFRSTGAVSLFAALWLGLCTFAISAYAQIGNANLGGTVTDQSGGVVAGADLTLTNNAIKVQTKATSNERGEYTFRNLTPGTYDLTATKQGFQSYVQTGIVVTINASAHADVVLKVGSVTETVTVSGENTLINYDNGTQQGGIDPRTIKDLPLVVEGKPRSSAALAVLLPGISTGSSNQAFQARINGGQESGDEALLDGATMQEGFMSQSGMVSIQQDFQMSPDMVQEVKVITSSYDAQYGSSTSGQITMVTKSGTSRYHGAAFEYARNAALNSAQWGKTSASHDNEHNFGANIGGAPTVRLSRFHPCSSAVGISRTGWIAPASRFQSTFLGPSLRPVKRHSQPESDPGSSFREISFRRIASARLPRPTWQNCRRLPILSRQTTTHCPSPYPTR
jgi:hypothetical protein